MRYVFLLFGFASIALLAIFIRFLIASPRPKRQRAAIGALVLVAVLAWMFLVNRVLLQPDEQRIERTIELVASRDDPSLCRTRMTPRYVAQLTGVPTVAAQDVCEATIAEEPTHEVETNEVEVDGDTATATVTGRGGGLDGSRYTERLVREGGRWKLDRLLGFVRLDRPGFDRAYRERLREAGLARSSVDCILEKSGRLSDAEIEAAYVDEASRPFLRFSVACDRGAAERLLVESAAEPEYGLSEAAVACVDRELRRRDDRGLADLQGDPIAFGAIAYECGRGEILSRYERELRSDGDLEPGAIACIMDTFRSDHAVAAVRLTYDRAAYAALLERCGG